MFLIKNLIFLVKIDIDIKIGFDMTDMKRTDSLIDIHLHCLRRPLFAFLSVSVLLSLIIRIRISVILVWIKNITLQVTRHHIITIKSVMIMIIRRNQRWHWSSILLLSIRI